MYDNLLKYAFLINRAKVTERAIFTSQEYPVKPDSWYRLETDGEHSFDVAMLALYFFDVYADDPFIASLDRYKVLKYCIIHDVVEAEAGDISVFAIQNNPELKVEYAKRIAEGVETIKKDYDFVPTLGESIECFEELSDPEANFVKILDRLAPFLLQVLTDFASNKFNNRTLDDVRDVMLKMRECPIVFKYVVRILKDKYDYDLV